jgi:hypothetical protein
MGRRRLVVTALVLAAGAGVAVAAAAGLREDSPAAKPRLRVTSLAPFAVAGTGFRDGETVRVTVHTRTGAAASTTSRTGSAGRIAARFPRLKLGRCPEYTVGARGDKGSTAGLRSVPQPCGALPGTAP